MFAADGFDPNAAVTLGDEADNLNGLEEDNDAIGLGTSPPIITGVSMLASANFGRTRDDRQALTISRSSSCRRRRP